MVSSMASSATLVLPAPVGAHTNMFSFDLKADLNTSDWMRFSCFSLGKQQPHHSGRLETATSASFSSGISQICLNNLGAWPPG